MSFSDYFQNKFNKSISQSSDEQIYYGLMEYIKKNADSLERIDKKKKLYYVSAEFLIGKLLTNNLINLGIYDEVKKELEDSGKNIENIEDYEPEPSLGNGGLGRLAACFLDSGAALGLPCDGVGINYHFGLFKQVFENCKQTEFPNPWIEKESWLKRTKKIYTVPFNGFSLNAVLYKIDVIGYGKKTNSLNLFDIDSVDESIVTDGIYFDKQDIEKNLTLFLYPDDSDENGKILRLYQEYFMSYCSAKLIIDEAEEKGSDMYDLNDYAVVQINDTHPSLIIPCLIKLLEEKGMSFYDSLKVISEICAYTNHTIMAEALEKWKKNYINIVAPDILPCIEKLDEFFKNKFTNENVEIIDKDDKVHMARLDIHCCFSVNGVASLHTEILKNVELNEFYKIYPYKFNNKTNGISFRRWLLHSNKELSEYISTLIGDGYKKDSMKLCELKKYYDDIEVLENLINIKKNNKLKLKNFIYKNYNIVVDENSVFDIQAKRLHEYKRQQLNILYAIYKYQQIKKGIIPAVPITFIFAAKAAPAYTMAKDIIHLILCLQKVINNDESVNKYIKVVMMENYNVTIASKLVSACDVSEQISLASKEASGTGNMKFMLNGGITIGTEDGANVEIHSLVGDNNIYIFGNKSEDNIKIFREGNYISKNIYDKIEKLKEAVDFITSDTMVRAGDSVSLNRLKNELINKDRFMTFIDFEDYITTKDRLFNDYTDRMNWARKMLVNISCSGYFSSDRTICEYNKDIWHLQ